MRLLAIIATLLIALASPAQTLRDVLKTNGIPESTFNASELDGNVNAAAAIKDNRVLVVYMRVDKSNMFTGDPLLIQFNRNSRAIVRTEIKPEDTDRCCGSPDNVQVIGEYLVLSFHVNPSAATMLVLSKDLKLVTTLYGFDLREAAPGQLVFIENMIHFAPVHPERLQLANLRTGRRVELYPPQGDALRAEFAREHARHMPQYETCMQMNDSCTPELYDEDIEFTDNDRGGNFEFIVRRDASHRTDNGQPPETVASAAALYRYAWDGQNNWMYCEERLSEDEATGNAQRQRKRAAGTRECIPNLPVRPDTSNADFSPFDQHRHD